MLTNSCSAGDRVRGVRRLLACAPALALIVLGGCDAKTERAQPNPVTVTLKPQPSPPGPGRFYVEAGANSLDADLFEMRFSPLDFVRLTTKSRVTTISGCDRALIVSAAQKEVGYADRLQVFKDGALQPIDGLGRPPASDPHVAPDCRILYYEQTGANDALVGEIRVWDPAKSTMTTVEKGDPDLLAGGTWGPGGAIAVLRRGSDGAKVTVIRPDGSRREVNPEMANAGNTEWGTTGWLALGELPAGGGDIMGTIFVNPDTGGRKALPGWAPLVWSPDGARFLVAKADDRSHLGVVEVGDLTGVRDVGSSTVGPIWDAAWLPV